MSRCLLIIEDEALLGQELLRHFRHEAWDARLASSLAAARELLLGRAFEAQVVLSDMNLPDGSALDLLESCRGAGVAGEWVLLTGYGSVPDSVRAIRLGAHDFLEKPATLERLDMAVAGALRLARSQARLADQTAAQERRFGPESFLGDSPAAREVREMLARLAQVPYSALLIGGETGTGKGLAARILHYAGPRRGGPLVEINCAALPRELMEGELFGAEAGAYTGAKGRRRGLIEQAGGGTLFLDELGELPLDLQVKLLKAIEDRRIRRLGGEQEVAVDVQVIAASNRDLAAEVRAGGFRADLYHRLGVFRLDLPALRGRKGDLRQLVPRFVEEFNAKAGKRVRRIPDAVWRRLEAHDWPGNVRELRNVVERGVLFADADEFPERWLQLAAEPAPGPGGDGVWLPLDGSLDLEAMEKAIVEAALARADGNVTAAARLLGSTRETLRYRVEKFGLAR
ncbi:sigma-54-dependent Fis family transcriptional regulator [Parasulfuritortus cantonensis]|uniref:Sigma-54-dependent Fis family transcriptional regulator n=1 Tax=Parasulfuritortus cantonensis TaxID=2528202 RepID=A0A4R1B6Q5_9PROT|nr:sigma-54 dependent transcriptional regulator [Parasulfuritortus cantonensis]TCJ13420.1 sigma-54-dependent Fis family transcriptional regulator [Parasulfuritortus cantonensis]